MESGWRRASPPPRRPAPLEWVLPIFRGERSGKVYSLGATFTNPWGDVGSEGGAGCRGWWAGSACEDGRKGKRERRRPAKGKKRRKMGRKSPGARAGVWETGWESGKGRGRKWGGRARLKQSAAGSPQRVVAFPPISLESFDLVRRPAGLGGDVKVANRKASLKGLILENSHSLSQPAFSSAQHDSRSGRLVDE